MRHRWLEDACGVGDDIACDAVVLAPDILNGTAGIEWAARTFGEAFNYELGNHEYYSHDATELMPCARACAADLGVHLLERDELWIGGMRFLVSVRPLPLDEAAQVDVRLLAPPATRPSRSTAATHRPG